MVNLRWFCEAALRKNQSNKIQKKQVYDSDGKRSILINLVTEVYKITFFLIFLNYRK
jgi:hypothetical protein